MLAKTLSMASIRFQALLLVAFLAAEPPSAKADVPASELESRLARKVERIEATDVSSELKVLVRDASAAALEILDPSRAGMLAALDPSYRHALVIGNGSYQHLPDLATAKADARVIADVLALQYGFDALILLDASRYEILSALDELRRELTERDSLVIYYSGHSEQERGRDRCFWLPIDAEAESASLWISTPEISDILDTMAARHVLVLADSCYEGIGDDEGIRVEGPPALQEDWLAVAKGRSRVAVSGGGLAPTLDGAGGDHSIFANGVLEVLQENDGPLTGPDLAREIARAEHNSIAILTCESRIVSRS